MYNVLIYSLLYGILLLRINYKIRIFVIVRSILFDYQCII